MSELIVLENAKYKIYRKSINTQVNMNVNEGVPFVSCGAETGTILGRVRQISSMPSFEYLKAVNEGSLVRPLVLFCETNLQAKTMFENIKDDNSRFTKLAGEIQKQKIMTSARNQFSVVETFERTTNNSMEKGKRLEFNNGIFTSNDNY